MSIDAISWAFHQDIRPATHKIILLALADFVAQDGTVWSPLDVLANKTGLDRKTVVKAISELEASGYLADTKARRGHTGQLKVYRLITEGHEKTTLDKQYRKRNSTENGTVPFFPSNSTVFPHETVPFFPSNSTENGTRSVREPLSEPLCEPFPLIPHGGNRTHAEETGNNRRAEPPCDDPWACDFSAEELQSEPLPPPSPRRQRESEKANRDVALTAIMQAFRAVRFGRPTTDPVPAPEFARLRKVAGELLDEHHATPEQVALATDEALNRSDPRYVTLAYLSGHWTEITTPLPPARAASMGAPRLTPSEQRAAREKAQRDEQYAAMSEIERRILEDPFSADDDMGATVAPQRPQKRVGSLTR